MPNPVRVHLVCGGIAVQCPHKILVLNRGFSIRILYELMLYWVNF